MHISSMLPVYTSKANAVPSTESTKQPSESGPLKPKMESPVSVNFSSITPRQLQAYLDRMLESGDIDVDDASSLGGLIPLDLYTECPDSPIDLRETVKGVAEFDRRNGYDALAAFYEGLATRMNLMEQRSQPVSVMA